MLPQWLREEIADGRTPMSRPTRWDWGCLWVGTTAVVVMMVLAVVLFLEHQRA
jgi:hypothetical protein